jgi:hypothetical protein
VNNSVVRMGFDKAWFMKACIGNTRSDKPAEERLATPIRSTVLRGSGVFKPSPQILPQ